jgi:hypothetical protein
MRWTLNYGSRKLNQGAKRMTDVKSKQPLKAKQPLKSGVAHSVVKTSKKRLKLEEKSVAQLKKEADKWHSLATRYRFAELVAGVWTANCITCMVQKPIKSLQCGHFQSRQYNILRYSEENTAPQCYGCNVMQQGRQYTFGLEIDKLYGDGTAKRLHQEAKTPHQFKEAELLEIIHDAKVQVEFYEGLLNGKKG